MRPTSVRLRLVAWNVSVLALALVGFTVLVHYMVRLNLSGSIDRGLEVAGRRLARESSEVQTFLLRLRREGEQGEARGEAREEGRRSEGPPPEGRRGGGLPGGRPWRSAPRGEGDPLPPGVFDLKGSPTAPFSRPTPWDAAAVERAAGGLETFSTVKVGADPVRVFTAPYRIEGRVFGAIQVARSLGDLNQLLANLSRTLVTLVPLALLAAALGGLLLTSRALSPVRHLSQAAAGLGTDDLSRRLPVTGGHEFEELASAFNRLLARLEEAFRKLEAAYERQRRFTADASHELRTPLAAIKASTSLALSKTRSPEEIWEALAFADGAADNMARIVSDMLTLARSDNDALSLDLRPTPVADILEQAVADVSRGQQGAPTRVEVADPSLCVLGDFHSLTRLVGNLLDNALRYTPPDGQVVASASASGDQVLLRVSDTGEGIAPEHLPHLCERFYRVDAARSRDHGGAGLGLAICKSLAEAHGGSLTLESAPGVGTTVTVALPRAAAEAPSPPEEEAAGGQSQAPSATAV